MKKNKIMVIGAVGAGKSTLIKRLTGNAGNATKTQSMEFTADAIDTPGEFTENPFYYRALFATSLEADIIIFIHDATKKHSSFPPGFAGAFSKTCIGVISKIDHPEADLEKAQNILKALGFTGQIYPVSAFTGKGIRKLKKALKW